jgi:hypothetical protein
MKKILIEIVVQLAALAVAVLAFATIVYVALFITSKIQL